jgi:hypothetical protein
MTKNRLVLLSTIIWFGLIPFVVADELTGIYHKADAKNPAYLEIDGTGFIKRIEVTGGAIPDGSRVWVEGDIKTSLSGKPVAGQKAPGSVAEITQQQPTQWHIVFSVTKWKAIAGPFETP